MSQQRRGCDGGIGDCIDGCSDREGDVDVVQSAAEVTAMEQTQGGAHLPPARKDKNEKKKKVLGKKAMGEYIMTRVMKVRDR